MHSIGCAWGFLLYFVKSKGKYMKKSRERKNLLLKVVEIA